MKSRAGYQREFQSWRCAKIKIALTGCGCVKCDESTAQIKPVYTLLLPDELQTDAHVAQWQSAALVLRSAREMRRSPVRSRVWADPFEP
eukprot:scaffold20325_cov33-Tisochrysis_lutea.AAC.1